MTTIQPVEHGDEATLVAQLREGASAAFETCVRQHGPRMLAVASRFFNCEQDRDDAVQDAFISAFRGIGSFDGKSKLTTWLHRITINACLMKVRSRSRKSEIPIDSLLPQFDDTGHRVNCSSAWTEDGYTQLAAKDSRERVRECIEQLPPTYREVLMLRDIQGMDTDETAQALNCSPANVKTRLHRARQALRTLLEPYFSETQNQR
jgi:RNA polymerase sigma-70 factor (ECF subfamily)